MNHAFLIAPEIFLSVMALAVLLGEAFFPSIRRLWVNLSVIALVLCLGHQVLFFIEGAFPGAASLGILPTAAQGGWVEYRDVFGMLAVDSLAVFFKIAILAAVIMVLWMSSDYFEFAGGAMGTYAGVVLLATVGAMFLVSSTDLLMAAISLELLSIASFILTGFAMGRRSSGEGALKFFLVGMLSTAVFLFGASYFYGYFGTTAIAPLQAMAAAGERPDLVGALVLMFLIAGVGFKLTMAPFHMWAPDAYEGAPTPVTAFLSSVPKAAAIAFMLRLFANHQPLGITPLLAVLAALTMTVGNLGALHQTNVKRMMAYSSVAHVGYILVALVAGGAQGIQAAMFYTFIYLFMNLGLFAGLLMISNQTRSDDASTFAGLYQKSMGLALAMLVFLLSLTGIPPLAGFVGKYVIFASVLRTDGLLWLAVVAVLNSVVSLWYYFRIVREMFLREPADGTRPVFSPALVSCLIVTLTVTILVGILPGSVLGWVRNVIGS